MQLCGLKERNYRIGTLPLHRELGADFLDRHHAEHGERYLLKRLERLGLQITVRRAEDTAALPA